MSSVLSSPVAVSPVFRCPPQWPSLRISAPSTVACLPRRSFSVRQRRGDRADRARGEPGDQPGEPPLHLLRTGDPPPPLRFWGARYTTTPPPNHSASLFGGPTRQHRAAVAGQAASASTGQQPMSQRGSSQRLTHRPRLPQVRGSIPLFWKQDGKGDHEQVRSHGLQLQPPRTIPTAAVRKGVRPQAGRLVDLQAQDCSSLQSM